MFCGGEERQQFKDETSVVVCYSEKKTFSDSKQTFILLAMFDKNVNFGRPFWIKDFCNVNRSNSIQNLVLS